MPTLLRTSSSSATRLRAKAKHLKCIPGWKGRTDPYVPFDLSVPMSGRRAPWPA
jgi:hypothetical protein